MNHNNKEIDLRMRGCLCVEMSLYSLNIDNLFGPFEKFEQCIKQ